MRVYGKVFVVTGAGNGIGRELALQLLARGGRVAAVDLDESGLQETAALAQAGDHLTTHPLNITDREAVLALPDSVVAAHGQVDALVNVAGIVHRFARVQDLRIEEIQRVLDVNFGGTVNTVKAFLPLLLKRPEASLVNFSSMGALTPVPGQSAYGASKAAVKLFTEGLYTELLPTQVTVTLVIPGGVSTGILENSGVDRGGRTEENAGTGSTLTTPQDAARQVVEAVEKGTFRVRIGKDARLLDRLSRLMPQRAAVLIAGRIKTLD